MNPRITTLALTDDGQGNCAMDVTLSDGSVVNYPNVIRSGYDATVETRLATQTEAQALNDCSAELKQYAEKFARIMAKFTIIEEMAKNGKFVTPMPTHL